MEESFRLGRVAGIRVEVNWSVLLIAWLLTWSLATVVLPQRGTGPPARSLVGPRSRRALELVDDSAMPASGPGCSDRAGCVL